jgi:hypothetical protein
MGDSTSQIAADSGAKSIKGTISAVAIMTLCNVLALFRVANITTSQRLLAIQPIGTVTEEAAMNGLWNTLPFILICGFMILMTFVLIASIPKKLLLKRSNSRWQAMTTAAAAVNCAFWPISCIQSANYEYAARTEAFRAAALRAAPLLSALDQYKTIEGTYPQSLNLLVPKYLEAIPDTNLAAYPNFEYRYSLEDHGTDDFSLWISCPVGGINFDEFVYAPDGNEEDEPHTDSYERVEDWIYVHE